MIMIMILCHSKLHVPEICGKICRSYAAYAAYMSHICTAYFPAYFASKSSAYFKKIFRYKPASLVSGNIVKFVDV